VTTAQPSRTGGHEPDGSVFRAAAAGADFYRVSVYGPGGRVDLAVPAMADIGGLIPLFVRHVGGDGAPDRNWLVQRLGEHPLERDGTPESLDLRDGDVLYLRGEDAAMPPLVYDDLPDGVGETILGRTDRWSPGATRGLCAALTGVAEAVLAAAVVSGAGALWAAIAAVLLAAGGAVAERLAGSLGLVLGLGAVAFAAGVAPLAGHGFGAQQVLLSGTGALVVAVALAATARRRLAVYGTAAVTAFAVAVSALLVTRYGWSPTSAVGTVAVALFLVGSLGPRLAARLARLRVPPLPRTMAELQQTTDPEPGDRLAVRVAAANAYLGSLVIGGGLAFDIAQPRLVTVAGWLGWVLPLLFAAAILLRARGLGSFWQRGALALAGGFGIGCVLLRLALTVGPIATVLLLAVVAALAVGTWRLPTVRLLPTWGHVADIAELWTAVALVPLLFQLLHVYAFFRALAG
jgi:type VII secretion integral membrane protein EccD